MAETGLSEWRPLKRNKTAKNPVLPLRQNGVLCWEVFAGKKVDSVQESAVGRKDAFAFPLGQRVQPQQIANGRGDVN